MSRLALYIAVVLGFPMATAANETTDDNPMSKGCEELGLEPECWVEVENQVCGDQPGCITLPVTESEPGNKRVVEGLNPELCTLLASTDSRAAAVLDAERIADIYADTMPHITSRATPSFSCGEERCKFGVSYEADIGGLATRAPDLFIWAHSVACGTVEPMDFSSFFPDNGMLREERAPASRASLKSRRTGLHQKMCQQLKKPSSRANLTEKDIITRYEKVLSGSVTLGVQSRNCESQSCKTRINVHDYSAIFSQTLACGWYGKQRSVKTI